MTTAQTDDGPKDNLLKRLFIRLGVLPFSCASRLWYSRSCRTVF